MNSKKISSSKAEMTWVSILIINFSTYGCKITKETEGHDQRREREKKKAILNGEMFQKYMIQIGQWMMVDWQVSINPKWTYIPKEQIESGFKVYLKK